MKTKINLPELEKRRVVVVGGGFAGLSLVRSLDHSVYQVVLLDKNNYHQFQPLLYQVAMAGLEPSSIAFPFRKTIRRPDVFFRMVEVHGIDPYQNRLTTSSGIVNYDFLVIATGSDTNYFGNREIMRHSIPMKSVSESLYLRNRILEDCERALTCTSESDRLELLTTVIAGGGPTGVELAGALAEMKKFVIPREYPELDPGEVVVRLVESGPRVLKSMSEDSSRRSADYLSSMGVDVLLGTKVVAYDGREIALSNSRVFRSSKLIWTAGVTASLIPGLEKVASFSGGRYVVDRFSRIKECGNVFAIGDVALMEEPSYPNGHPQVAPVAISQAQSLADNLNRMAEGRPMENFSYKDKGSMATLGRHAAVAEIGDFKVAGPVAWFLWLFVHLKELLGVKNKMFVLASWAWNYVTYDQPLRIIVRPRLQNVSDRNLPEGSSTPQRMKTPDDE